MDGGRRGKQKVTRKVPRNRNHDNEADSRDAVTTDSGRELEVAEASTRLRKRRRTAQAAASMCEYHISCVHTCALRLRAHVRARLRGRVWCAVFVAILIYKCTL